MVKKKLILTLEQRKKRLTSLIEDAEALKFNPHLIKEYNKQLDEVQKELQEAKEKRKKFFKRLKEAFVKK